MWPNFRDKLIDFGGCSHETASDTEHLCVMPTDPQERLREIALAIVPDPAWCNDPDNAALLDLVVELDITDEAQIVELLPPNEPWKELLAGSLASRSLPEPVGAPTADESTTVPTLAGLVAPPTDDELEESNAWADAGFLRSETAQLWAATGLDPAVARAWYDLDLRGPGEAMRWAEAGFMPSTAQAWVDLLDDPAVAASCVAVGLTPSAVVGLDGANVAALVGSMVEKAIEWSELCPYLERDIDPAVAFDWIERRRVNPVRVEWAYDWAARGLSLSDAVRWHAAGFPEPDVASEWRSKEFDARDAAAWVAAGVLTASDAVSLRSIVHTPAAFAAWNEMGISDPALISGLLAAGVGWSRTRGLVARQVRHTDLLALARIGPPTSGLEKFIERGQSVDEFHLWRQAGFDAFGALDWIEHGFESPESARQWLTISTDPKAARQWCNEDFQPNNAVGWISYGFSPRQAQAWVAIGVDKPASAQAWQNAGVPSPAVARAWMKLGCEWPDQAVGWIDVGLSLTSATPWIEAGIDPTTASSLASHRLSPSSVRRFKTESGRPAEELTQWLAHGIKFKEALEWCAAGVTSPSVARRRRATTEPAAWRRLAELGITRSEIAQIATSSVTDADISLLSRRASPASIDRLRESGTPPRDWASWMRVCKSIGIACDWIDGQVDLHDLEATVDEFGLDPRDLRTWISAGIEPRGVLEAYEAGFTSPKAWRHHLNPPKPRASRPNVVAKPIADSFLDWIEAGEAWLTAVGADVKRYDEFLRMIHDEGLEWAAVDEDVLGVEASEDWLDEIYERLDYVADALQKEPHWPKVFESEEITIVLDGTGDYPLAWVGDGASGGLVCFHPERYEVYTAATNSSWRYMVGAAISWFIDCCILLRLERKRLPFDISRHPASGRGLDRAAARYSPRPTFVSQYQTVRRGGGTSPRAHLVDGFVRTYQLGQQPTEAARSRAPARIRHRLKPNQTWVRPHVRGGTYAHELKTYLSRYSALADAMAFADQDSSA